jgi:glucose/arabinose dehydrogenase
MAAGPINLIPVVSGLTEPLYVTQPNDGTNRLFIVERRGTIRVAVNGVLQATPFLDIQNIVENGASEQGLLGLAFHPNYASNGQFFVYYTANDWANTLARYTVSSDPNRANTAGTVLLSSSDSFNNHNGGMLAFGPDGNLYIAMGDGGSSGDPNNNAQNRNSLLGKILRINVNSGSPYAIPSGNPFVGQANIRPEIWALGLRNPWRFSFDRANGDLWIGDVGQGNWEEIDRRLAGAAGGANFQWSCLEGTHAYRTDRSCTQGIPTGPIYEYDHSQGDCSITGGYVYRGASMPSLVGQYVFGDYCTGRIWALSGTTRTQVVDTPYFVASFGEDRNGELYVVDITGGTIYRMSEGGSPPPTPTNAPTATPTNTPVLGPTNTPTPVPPTPTPDPAGTQSVTFDDKTGQNQPLNGPYPTNVIDWGSGQWFHSAAWGSFTTKSASFADASRTSGSFTLLGGRRLVQLEAYNGGSGATILTLSCPGQTTKTVSIANGQKMTVATGWTAACANVTMSSTNGWYTNIDNVVLDTPKPDLVITSFTATNGTTSQPPRVTVTVQNRGNAEAGPGDTFDIHIFADLGRPPTISDINYAAHMPVSKLAPGASATVSGDVVPGALGAGTHTLSALADGHGVVAESDENNNAATTTTTVTTASPSPTPTVPGPSSQTLTFDDISGQNQPLNGAYPTGVADWGSGQWHLSSPWGRFTTKSVSFSGGRTNAGIAFSTPRRLLRLDAYNGGGGSSTITINCAGQPVVTVSLAAGQLQAISTSWTGTCSSVSISSTNGWDTNFDNLVIDRGP